jgi:hypothetical protein
VICCTLMTITPKVTLGWRLQANALIEPELVALGAERFVGYSGTVRRNTVHASTRTYLETALWETSTVAVPVVSDNTIHAGITKMTSAKPTSRYQSRKLPPLAWHLTFFGPGGPAKVMRSAARGS